MNKKSLKPREKLRPIMSRERQEFMRIWHSYHAKNKISYSYDEANRVFNSIALIFTEDN